MIPMNVMTTKKLNLPYLVSGGVNKRTITLPAARCIQMKANNEIPIKRTILNLITTPHLRSLQVFHFRETETSWTIYDPENHPLNHNEVKGAMVLAIQGVKSDTVNTLKNIDVPSNGYVQSTKTIIRHLESFSRDDKIFIVALFKQHFFSIGNYYDESTLCRALLNFRPRKVESVISNSREDVVNQRLFLLEKEELLQPKKMHFSFSSVS
jgi:hypothetical protein